MSWLFSRALVEAYSAGSCLDGAPYAQLNVMPTPHKFWHKDKTMDHSSLSQFGLTLKLLTESLGEELLTSYRADFLAKTLARKGGATDLMVSVQDCGASSTGLLAKWNQESSMWKTAQCSLFEDLEQSLETWPRAGSMRNGECYQRQPLERPIKEIESGLLPTPMASDWKGGTVSIRKDTGKQRLDQFRDWCKCLHGLTYPIPEHSEAMMGWPIGWSDLKPLETGRFHFVLQQHSTCCENGYANDSSALDFE